MNEADQKQAEREVAEFLKLQDFKEKCRYFHAHPLLHRYFVAHHFPNPDAAVEPPKAE